MRKASYSRRWRKPFLICALLASVTTLWLMGSVWGIPAVTMQNDLGHDMGLRNCREWHKISSDESAKLRPFQPCSVYRVDGRYITYLGCLHFPDDAFTNREPIALSTLDREVLQSDCARGEGYHRFAPWREGLTRATTQLTQ